MLDPHVQSEHEVGVEETMGNTYPTPSASSIAADSTSLAKKAISTLPVDLAAQAIDPKRKAMSHDLGWKFGWWPNPTKKDFVQCIFCMKVIPSGIKMFKQHLSGGFGNDQQEEHIDQPVQAEHIDIYEEEDNNQQEEHID
jgi:hypothetical protein